MKKESSQTDVPLGMAERRFYGKPVVIPIGGEQVGSSGFTRLEINALDTLAQERLRQVRNAERSQERGLFDLD